MKAKGALVTSPGTLSLLMDPQLCADRQLQDPSLRQPCTRCTHRSLGERAPLLVAAKGDHDRMQ